MNVNQAVALADLRRAAPTHDVHWSGRSTRHTVWLECSCGWRWSTNARNALARSAQMYGAEVRHLKEVSA